VQPRRGRESPVRANLPQRENGTARDKAAETVGLKPRTAEKGLAVLNRAEAGDFQNRRLLRFRLTSFAPHGDSAVRQARAIGSLLFCDSQNRATLRVSAGAISDVRLSCRTATPRDLSPIILRFSKYLGMSHVRQRGWSQWVDATLS